MDLHNPKPFENPKICVCEQEQNFCWLWWKKKVEKIKLHVIARTNHDHTPELWIISIGRMSGWHLKSTSKTISDPYKNQPREREKHKNEKKNTEPSRKKAHGSESDTKIETKEHQLIQRFDGFDIIFVVRLLSSSAEMGSVGKHTIRMSLAGYSSISQRTFFWPREL